MFIPAPTSTITQQQDPPPSHSADAEATELGTCLQLMFDHVGYENKPVASLKLYQRGCPEPEVELDDYGVDWNFTSVQVLDRPALSRAIQATKRHVKLPPGLPPANEELRHLGVFRVVLVVNGRSFTGLSDNRRACRLLTDLAQAIGSGEAIEVIVQQKHMMGCYRGQQGKRSEP